jgi:hypothetical protein
MFRGVLNNLRGLFQGVYRSKQYMWLLSQKFMPGEGGLINQFICGQVCSSAILLEQDSSPIEDKVSLSKSILKLLRELTHDRDQRFHFDTRYNTPVIFMQMVIKVTFSCLGIIKMMDI